MSLIRRFFDNKKYQAVIFLGFIGLLSGCNSYHVSETILNEEIETYLMTHPRPHVFVDIGDQVASLEMFITGISIDLMKKHGGTAKIHLSTSATGEFIAFRAPVSMSTHLRLTMSSSLTVKQGSIYLVNPILHSINLQGNDVSDDLLRATLLPFSRSFEKALAGYFYRHPIYELEHSRFEKETNRDIKDIHIEEDKLLLTFY